MGRYQAPEDADLVRPGRGPAAILFRGYLDKPWTGTRGTKADPVTGEHRLFGFLTTEPNAEVRPIHPKAMPVILKTPAEMEAWLMAPWGEVAQMQKPLTDGAIMVVARNIRADG